MLQREEASLHTGVFPRTAFRREAGGGGGLEEETKDATEMEVTGEEIKERKETEQSGSRAGKHKLCP